MSAGVFSYSGTIGQSLGEITATVNGITVTVPAATLETGNGELPVYVSGTPDASVAGKAFDIPVTVLGEQLYVRVSAGCGAYTSATRTIPSTGGDPSWRQFQCFNLGADTSLDPFTWKSDGNEVDHDIKGYLYQWGRPTDGHQLRFSGTTTTLATNNQATEPADVVGKFIKTSGPPDDWRDGGGHDNRWGNGTGDENPQKAANDPCPAGWKVPSQKQWASIFRVGLNNGGPSVATSNTWTWSETNHGYLVGDALYLPAVGYRNHNTASTVINGTTGYYATSSYDVTYSASNHLRITSGMVYSGAFNMPRADGYSVRCIEE
jgi:uncharacterized protein (TIGR02145 family)